MLIKYLIVLDTEATCFPVAEDTACYWFQEMIEWGAVILNMQSGRIEREFHSYIRPTHFPQLSRRCMEKTRITQQQVDRAPMIEEVLDDFLTWLQDFAEDRHVTMPTEQMLYGDEDYMLFCTWSNMDLGCFLRNECLTKEIDVPGVMQYWVDAQKVFRESCPGVSTQLDEAITALDLERLGQPHSAMGDAKSLARLIVCLRDRGGHFDRLNMARD